MLCNLPPFKFFKQKVFWPLLSKACAIKIYCKKLQKKLSETDPDRFRQFANWAN